MKCAHVVTALVTASALATATLALADSRHHHRRGVPPAYYNPSYGYGYPIAPYGYATPSYSSRYGTYPAHTYDPDPNLRSQLRSDFNRGVDFPGNGR